MAGVRYKLVERDGKEFVEEYHKVVVHTFELGDVEDPDIYAAAPIYQWQESEQGKFVMEHATDTEWHRQLHPYSLGWKYAVVAELETKKLSEFYLKWGKPNGSDTGR